MSSLPSSSSLLTVRASRYSSAWTLRPRCLAKLSGATVEVTSRIGTFASAPFLQPLEHLEPGLLGFLDADDDQRRRRCSPERDRLVGIGFRDDLELIARQLRAQGRVKRGIGVDQQDASVHAPLGMIPESADLLLGPTDQVRGAPRAASSSFAVSRSDVNT